MTHSLRASADTIQRRLEARNAQVDRQLEQVLARLGLTPRALDHLASRAATLPSHAARAAAARIERELGQGGVSWEEISRPDLASLNHQGPVRMIRA
ncbi:MAG: hypothetical protein IT371_15185 [Deltaproteobacteria bacterium]|nr:hypothetical protein [Deltaproteobacteria bacterium]